MNLLLDTHALLWWLFDDVHLSVGARDAIANVENKVFVSSASAWEIATKHRIGKLPLIGDIIDRFAAYLRRDRFEPCPVGIEHALRAGMLPGPHRDPFDRMLIAQAEIERLTVVTTDSVFSVYGVPTLW